jgi:hypothetical protein
MTHVRLSRAKPLAWCGPETERCDGDYMAFIFCPKRCLNGPGRTRPISRIAACRPEPPFFNGLGIGKSPSATERVVPKTDGTDRSLSGVDQSLRSRQHAAGSAARTGNRLLAESTPYVDPASIINSLMMGHYSSISAFAVHEGPRGFARAERPETRGRKTGTVAQDRPMLP